MNEWTRAAAWLNTVLGGAPAGGGDPADPIDGLTGGVHEHPAPQNPTYPLITFQDTAPEDMTVVGEDRIWTEFLVLVTAITTGRSYAPIEEIADAIDDRLHGAQFAAAGDDAMVLSSVRERPFSQPILENGISYRRLGGLYRLIVQPLGA